MEKEGCKFEQILQYCHDHNGGCLAWPRSPPCARLTGVGTGGTDILRVLCKTLSHLSTHPLSFSFCSSPSSFSLRTWSFCGGC